MLDSALALLQMIRRSRVLSTTELNVVRRQSPPASDDPRVLAAWLIDGGWLTPFQASQLLEGQDHDLVFGPYHVLDLLGEGALGRVFRALHRSRHCTVALKVLRPEVRTDPVILQQFWQERAVLASLDHPAFIRALDDEDATEARDYFAMELIDGIDLGKLLQLAGPLPVAAACDYVRQAAVGLQYAYEHGLVHRDVKPSNLLVSFAAGQVRILDIGSARREWRPAEGPTGGALMGTPDYIAPEQTLDPHAADIRADIYGLGCTFYHLLTGRPPFPGGSLARKLLDHQQTPPLSVREARPELPPELETIVGRMLRKRPEDRYATPALVAVALARFCDAAGAGLDLERFRPYGVEAAETLRGAGPDEEAEREPGTVVEPAPPPQPKPAPAPPARDEAGWAERRASPRRGGHLVPVLIASGPAREEPIRGWVLDRSSGGLGLWVGEALEIGTVVRVRPDLPGMSERWAQVCIMHCRRERVRWRVGCQFVGEVGWAMLRAFG